MGLGWPMMAASAIQTALKGPEALLVNMVFDSTRRQGQRLMLLVLWMAVRIASAVADHAF